MSDKSAIEWTDATWNPVTGCTKVSPGCDNCYAERIDKRWGRDFSKVMLRPDRLEEPLCWKKPRMVFTCSMADLFHSQVRWDFLGTVFDVMIETPRHTYQVLTKRVSRMAWWAENMAAITHERQLPWEWPENVWAGASVESQLFIGRLNQLARVPAKVRFVSAEPLLGPLDLALDMKPISWVIVGGESGPGARPMDLDWARTIRDQCALWGVPFFLKQLGGVKDKRSGDKAVLDGRTWREFPA